MRTADITGKVELPENVKMVMPGDNVTAVFELIQPVPLESGMLEYSLRRWSFQHHNTNPALLSLAFDDCRTSLMHQISEVCALLIA